MSAGRLGDIAFANCFPIRWGLRGAVDLVSDTPPRLCRALLAGALDVSPISLVDYLTHADDLVLLPDLALGADGPVHSCVVLSRRPLDELDGALVGLSDTSRTTVRLAKILLERAVGVRPRYRDMPQCRQAPPPDVDAMVLIGDDALVLGTEPPRGWRAYDTAELWQRWTDLPMVFAVWAVRREHAEWFPDETDTVRAALRCAVARAAAARGAVTRAAAAVYPELGERVLARYFAAISYDLGPRQRAAIRAFTELLDGVSGAPPRFVRKRVAPPLVSPQRSVL